jgi:hypothetical protein
MRFIPFQVFILLCLTTLSPSQDKFEEVGYLKNPFLLENNLLFTDNYASAIYIQTKGQIKTLVSSPGCGNYFSISFDKKFIGYKSIDENMKQSPCLIDLSGEKILPLYNSVNQCGQVSFSIEGKTAFTIGNSLIVLEKDKTIKYELGVYSNWAPISPNGDYAAYNDNNDQLWIINLLTNKKEKITDDKSGYFYPLWAPNSTMLLFSSLGGAIYVYNINQKQTYSLGDGFSPSWSPNSENIIFYKKHMNNTQYVGSDIFISCFDGSKSYNITNSPHTFEMDPRFVDNNSIIYHTFDRKEIYSSNYNLQKRFLEEPVLLAKINNEIHTKHFNTIENMNIKIALDIPYVHQVWDTPDWFNGHSACGATTAIMAIAYYNALPKWEGWCSWPTGHINYWGRYVSDKYRFRMVYYALAANDPNGKPSYGGFGFMWNSGSPHTKMSPYYSNHGITSSTTDGPPYSAFETEINAGYPYSICNGLTTSGHIILGHGYGTSPRSIVTNDPYGNKNTPGYPSYDGKNAIYDWPGYNNGYQNLNHVYWCTTNRFNPPAISDTLVDDLQLERGFYLHTKAPSSMEIWKDLVNVTDGHSWYTYTKASTIDTCYATWKPNLLRDGNYEVLAYIPFSNAVAARYKVYFKEGFQTITINQKQFTNSWVSLGKFNFTNGNSGYVRLGDGSDSSGQEIIFDRIWWKYNGPYVSIKENDDINKFYFSLSQNHPNPFNPSTDIRFQLSTLSYVTLKVYDVLGNEVETLVDEEKQPGTYTIKFPSPTTYNYQLKSGIYFYQFKAGNLIQTKKMVLTK